MLANKAAYMNDLFESLQAIAKEEGITTREYIGFAVADVVCAATMDGMTYDDFVLRLRLAWNHAKRLQEAMLKGETLTPERAREALLQGLPGGKGNSGN